MANNSAKLCCFMLGFKPLLVDLNIPSYFKIARTSKQPFGCFEISEFWKVVLSKFCNLEILYSWNAAFWNCESLDFLNFGTLRRWNFEILKYWNLGNQASSKWKRRYPKYINIRLIMFWKSWIWDQYLPETSNERCA